MVGSRSVGDDGEEIGRVSKELCRKRATQECIEGLFLGWRYGSARARRVCPEFDVVGCEKNQISMLLL